MSKKWTEYEIQILKENYSKYGSKKAQELLPHRSLIAVQTKATKMKIPGLFGQTFQNLTNKRFEYLVALRYVKRKNYVFWLCLCDCGNYKWIRSGNLLSGTISCGCYQRKWSRNNLLGRTGKLNHNWKGNNRICSHVITIRESSTYQDWRTQVFERDNYTCQYSGQVGGKLQVHHKKGFAQILKENNITTLEQALACEELWDVENGVTLTKKDHKKFHKLYGRKFCTYSDFNDWIKHG